MTRLFTGDYSTGDFRQWSRIATQLDVPTANYPKDVYSARILPDGDGGWYARYEVRNGDIPSFGGGQRAEVIDSAMASLATAGQTRWYAQSVRFDPDFPVNHLSLGSGVVTQWHDSPNALYSPVLALGWPGNVGSLLDPAFRDGYWYLRYAPQSAPGVTAFVKALFEFPYRLGQWHDIKLQVKWAKDNTGFIRLWWNGQRQILSNGLDTYTGPTLPLDAGPASNQLVNGVILQQGYYRDHDIVPTGVVHHRGMRMASTEDTL